MNISNNLASEFASELESPCSSIIASEKIASDAKKAEKIKKIIARDAKKAEKIRCQIKKVEKKKKLK